MQVYIRYISIHIRYLVTIYVCMRCMNVCIRYVPPCHLLMNKLILSWPRSGFFLLDPSTPTSLTHSPLLSLPFPLHQAASVIYVAHACRTFQALKVVIRDFASLCALCNLNTHTHNILNNCTHTHTLHIHVCVCHVEQQFAPTLCTHISTYVTQTHTPIRYFHAG